MSGVVVSSENATLTFYPESQIVHHSFRQPIQDLTQDALDAAVEMLNETGTIKWLSDDHPADGLAPAETTWMMDDWAGYAGDDAWKYWALVVPEETIDYVDISRIVERYYDLGVRVMLFTTVEFAEDWLLKQ